MKTSELKIAVGDWVENWQGGLGRVTSITADGAWLTVKDGATDRIDEWQPFQLRLRVKAMPKGQAPIFLN